MSLTSVVTILLLSKSRSEEVRPYPYKTPLPISTYLRTTLSVLIASCCG